MEAVIPPSSPTLNDQYGTPFMICGVLLRRR